MLESGQLGRQHASYQITGIGVGVIILARVCSTANLLNSSTVAPPLRLSNTTTIPVQIKESNRSVLISSDSVSANHLLKFTVIRLTSRLRKCLFLLTSRTSIS